MIIGNHGASTWTKIHHFPQLMILNFITDLLYLCPNIWKSERFAPYCKSNIRLRGAGKRNKYCAMPCRSCAK